MDRESASNTIPEDVARTIASGSEAARRDRGTMRRWWQPLLAACLLLGAAVPAWADGGAVPLDDPPVIELSSGLEWTYVGVAYADSITASGGTAPYSYAVSDGALPAGLTLDAATGAITGTATAGGIFGFTVTATDSSTGGPYSGSLAYELVVYSPDITLSPPDLPDGVVNEAYSQTFQASGGTAPYSYEVYDGTLPPGLTLTADGVLSGTPTAAGTFNFTFYATDSSTGNGPYSLPGIYEVTIGSGEPIANPVNATVSYGSGANPITLDVTGGVADSVAVAVLPAHGAAIASGTAITYQPDPGHAGPDSFTYTATNARGTSAPATVSIDVSPPDIIITPSAPLTAQVGTAYSQTFTWSGGAVPYNGYSVTGLPAGLVVTASDTDSVTVSGTPTQGGSFTVSVSASDSSTGNGPFTTDEDFSLQVDAPSLSMTPADGSTLAVTYPQPYSQVFSASGGVAPYTYSLTGTLPAGMSFDSATGTLSGTPAEAGPAFPFTVTATDSSTGAGGPYSVSQDYVLQVDANIDLSPSTLANGTVGASYQQALDATGGVAPYTFAMDAGTSLPPGLGLAPDGAISGTPTASGSYSFTISATDANGVGSLQGFSVTMAAATLTVAPDALPGGAVDTPYSQAISATGGIAPYSYAIVAGTLPSGFSLDAGTGVLSGSTSTAGSYSFDVQVSDSSGGTPATGTVSYTLVIDVPTITLAPATLPDGAVFSGYSQAITASGGIAPHTFSVTVGSLPDGLSLAADGTLSGTPTETGGFSFAVTAADSSSGSGPYSGTGNYTLTIVDVAPTANDVSATVAYGSGATPITLDISGSAATSVAVANAPAHGVATASGLSISYEPAAGFAGVDSFTYLASNAVGDSAPATVSITVSGPTLALTPAAGTLEPDYGVAWSQAFSASGGAAPYTYALTGTLPAGLVFDAASGTLSGTATEAGNFPVTVTATDSSTGAAAPFSVSADYEVQVVSAAIVITPAALADGIAGRAYSQALGASGGIGPYTFAITAGSLPDGLQLAGDGTLSGTPTASGTFDATVSATDANGQAVEHAYSLTIGVATLDVTPASVPAGTVGVAYSQDFTTSGGVAPYSYALGGGALPPGMALGSDGVLSGMPTSSGSFEFDLQVTDDSGGTPATGTASQTLVINAPTITLAPGTLPDGTAGAEYSQAFTASGGTAPHVFSVTSGSLPDGLSLAGDGTLSGTPTADGAFAFTVEARDAHDQPGSRDYTLAVAGVVPVAAAHHAQMLAGSSVEVELTERATGGPFTGAEALAIMPVDAGSASVARVGDGADAGYRLTFTGEGDYAGTATVRYTLSNATATSAPATVTIEIAARPDPTLDPEVTGLLRAQVQSVRRLAEGQIGNFQGRLERLHGNRGGANGLDNGMTFMVDRPCAANDWQRVGSTCQRPLSDEQAPVQAPAQQAAAQAASTGQAGQAAPFAIWTAGAMRFGDYDPQRGASGFEFETSGMSIGGDYRFSPAFALGAGFGYGRDISDIGERDSRSKAEAWSTAVYASYHPGDHVYLDGLLGYQRLSLDLRRHVGANDATVAGDRDGHQWFVSLAAGYQWQREQLRLTPYARIDHASAELDGYVEHGDPLYALAFEQQDIDTTTTSLGLRMDYVHELDWGMFAPQLRLEYQHDLDADSVAVMRYADLPLGPWYRTAIDGFDRNRLEVGLGAAWQTRRQFGLRLEYLHRLGNSGVDDQSLRLQLEKQF